MLDPEEDPDPFFTRNGSEDHPVLIPIPETLLFCFSGATRHKFYGNGILWRKDCAHAEESSFPVAVEHQSQQHLLLRQRALAECSLLRLVESARHSALQASHSAASFSTICQVGYQLLRIGMCFCFVSRTYDPDSMLTSWG